MNDQKLHEALSALKRPSHRWIVGTVVSLLSWLERVRQTILAMFNDNPPGGAA